jgi:release factor glutamine methyltransferase
MKLAELKSLYISSLSMLYDPTEVESIFFLFASSVLNYSKIEIHQKLDSSIDPKTEKNFLDSLERLRLGEPAQYVLGFTEFCDARIRVDSRVLIPRPETELLTDIIIKEQKYLKNLRIADLCTGSGCIAIALAKKMSAEKVIALDISDEALELASINAKDNNAKIDFIRDDLRNLRNHYPKINIIVSNPPYVRESEKQQMHINILEHEPAVALFVSDSDPLIYYRALANFGLEYMAPGGTLYAEINENFGSEVKSLFLSGGYSTAEIRKDLREKDRYLIART